MHTVLIVDDHPVIRLAVRVLLEKHGLQVVAETDMAWMPSSWSGSTNRTW